MPHRFSSPGLLAVLSVVLSSVALVRELARDGLRLGVVRASKGARILSSPNAWYTWFKVVRVLTTRETQSVVRADPQLVLKHLRTYLGTNLSRHDRSSLLIDHYSFLRHRVNPDFFRTIVRGRLPLFEHVVGARHYRVSVTFLRENHDEGDLSLIFTSDETDIYTLSLTIGPGSVAGLDADRAIYIGRVQGKRAEFQLIRDATKDCGDIAPAALLLAAAEGVAMALELGHIVGIGADGQISAASDSRADGLVHSYDEFWIASGGIRLVRNMYHLQVPALEKPIQSIKRNHRARALRKRDFRKLVKGKVCRAFVAGALRPGDVC